MESETIHVPLNDTQTTREVFAALWGPDMKATLEDPESTNLRLWDRYASRVAARPDNFIDTTPGGSNTTTSQLLRRDEEILATK